MLCGYGPRLEPNLTQFQRLQNIRQHNFQKNRSCKKILTFFCFNHAYVQYIVVIMVWYDFQQNIWLGGRVVLSCSLIGIGSGSAQMMQLLADLAPVPDTAPQHWIK
jgi:hypothetical protein